MRSFETAKTFAIHEHQQSRGAGWFNLCQMFSRQCIGADPFGLSARQAFNSIPAKHRFTSHPPRAGAIAYYGRSDEGAGHAVFVVEGGRVWSNDILRRGRIDRVDWDIFPRRWGLAYRGWIDWCPSGDLDLPEKRRKNSKHKDDYRQDRKVYRSKMRFRQDDSDSVWNLQRALLDAGLKFFDGPTGCYGRHTRQACREFQRRQGWRGVEADGIAGPETIRRLGLVWDDD